MIKRLMIGSLGVLWWASVVEAADNNFPTPGNATAPGAVQMCLNASGQAVPVSNGVCGSGAQAQVTDAATTNGSVKITTGLTYQTMLAALGSPPAIRRSLTIQNNQASGTDVCYLIIGASAATVIPGTTTTSSNVTVAGQTITAAQASIVLSPGQAFTRYFPYVPSDIIYGTCATTGESLYVDTQ